MKTQIAPNILVEDKNLLAKIVQEQTEQTDDLLPLSFAQQRLWFLDQMEPQSPLYNIPTALRIQGFLNITALKESLEAIVERHEILRTIYTVVNDTPTQQITERFSVELPLFDLSHLPDAEKEKSLAQRLQDEGRRPFNLSTDLMLRVALFRLHVKEHVLLLNIHHIACDEWSMRILFRELARFYQAFCDKKPAPLKELPIQYADFALWQRDWLKGPVLDEQLQYWKKHLGTNLPVLELPTDHPRPAVQTHRGALEFRTLSRGLNHSLKALGRKEGATPYMILLAAFKTLLHRYTSQNDIIVGTPIAGRNRVETESLIGFFVNTLALRTDFSDNPTFRQLLVRVRESSLGAFSHQDLPFEKLVEEIQPERNASQNPLFNVIFALQNGMVEELQIPGLTFTATEVDSGTAKFDLTLVMQDEGENLIAALEYNTDLFTSATARRLLGHLESLLEGIVANPDQRVSHLPLLTAAERHQTLLEWNQTRTHYPKDVSIAQLFEAQVKRTPNSVAVIYGEEKLTYAELDERANQLAHYLKKSGVGRDTLVGIFMTRSVEMIIGWLGILKAGGAYVPLDITYPPERLRFMLEDTQMPMLLTQKKWVNQLSDVKAQKISLDADWKTIAREDKAAAEDKTTAENIAYVIYTSGSTGKPKGVVVPHRGIVRLLFNTNYIQLDSSDRIAQASNSSFDAATFEVWGALLFGGTLIGVDKDLMLSPQGFAAFLQQEKISTLFLTTALFNQMAAEAPTAFSNAKTILFGGEACDPKSVAEIVAKGKPKHLLHVYGPTESTTFASAFEVKNVPDGAHTLPIGGPISNTTFYVLNRNLQPMPVGLPGELYIGGDGLARGYFNRPELTEEKFIRNPFSQEQNARLYKTGDLVRWSAEGAIEFVGRIDHQVKIRGFRIELEEIENVLEQFENIRDCIVLAREEKAGDKRLVAYLILEQAPAPSLEKLRGFLKQKLPDFMVPSNFIFLDAFPLTPNGKVDRNALPAPSENQQAESEAYQPPRNNLENRLTKIWETVLGRKPIGIRDNFFDLGGHSLLAVRLFAHIEKVFGQKLPLPVLFQAPTIEQLAVVIGGKGWSSPGSSLVEIQPNGSKPPIFWLHTLGGGGGGGLFTYHKVANLLGADQPSYGLVTPPEPFAELSTMAAHYIQEMRTLQPTGPYYLGGYCFGGIIAFEMARQLKEKGEKVGMLALLESVPPNTASGAKLSKEFLVHFMATLPLWLVGLWSLSPGEISKRIKLKVHGSLQRLFQFLPFREKSTKADADSRLKEVLDMEHYPADFKRYAEIHWKALGNYFPQLYPGRITLFRTRKPRLFSFNPEIIWGSIALGGVDVKLVPGSHEQILEEPYVKELAGALKSSLEEAHRQNAG